jgi:hypothetical protein
METFYWSVAKEKKDQIIKKVKNLNSIQLLQQSNKPIKNYNMFINKQKHWVLLKKFKKLKHFNL